MANNLDDIYRKLAGLNEPTEPEDQLVPDAMSLGADQEAAEINEQANQQAMAPSMKTKEQLEAEQIEKELDVPAPEAPKTPLQELLEKSNALREKSAADIKTASEEDKRRALGASIAKALGNLGAANIQARTGQNVGLKGFKPVEVKDTASKIGKQRNEMIRQLQDEYKLLQADRKSGMTPYQKAQLEESEKDRALKEKLAKVKAAITPKKETEFGKALSKAQAKDFAESQSGLQKTAGGIDKIDEALISQLEYSKSKFGGTGPLATLGGFTKYVSSDTEALDAKFKDIDLKNMVTTFSGMSKAVDSDAERRAWKATQASVSNDDKTNVQILLGSKSSLLKNKAIAEAKAEFVKQRGNLNEFTHPILEGKVTTLVDLNGNMQLVEKNKVADLKANGFITVDQHALDLLAGKKSSDAIPRKIQRVMAANPGITREEVIEALKKKGKL